MQVLTRRQRETFDKLAKIAGDPQLVLEVLFDLSRKKPRLTLGEVIETIKERRWEWHGVERPRSSNSQ